MKKLRLERCMTFSLFYQQVAKVELKARRTRLSLMLLWHIPGRPKWPGKTRLPASLPASPPALCGCFASCWIPEVSGLIRACTPASAERQLTGIQSDHGSLQIIKLSSGRNVPGSRAEAPGLAA